MPPGDDARHRGQEHQLFHRGLDPGHGAARARHLRARRLDLLGAGALPQEPQRGGRGLAVGGGRRGRRPGVVELLPADGPVRGELLGPREIAGRPVRLGGRRLQLRLRPAELRGPGPALQLHEVCLRRLEPRLPDGEVGREGGLREGREGVARRDGVSLLHEDADHARGHDRTDVHLVHLQGAVRDDVVRRATTAGGQQREREQGSGSHLEVLTGRRGAGRGGGASVARSAESANSAA